VLDEAIAELAGGTGAGPGIRTSSSTRSATDAAVRRAKWIGRGTLKARYFMIRPSHWGTRLHRAIAAAITHQRASGNGDFRSFHTKVTASEHVEPVQTTSGFGADLEAGRFLGDYMNAATIRVAAAYFCLNALGGYA